MLHLALVQNLLTAIGSAPHLGRPEFPSPAPYFPPGVSLALVPFGEQALRHFMYLERPEGMPLENARSGMRIVSVTESGVTHRYYDFGELPETLVPAAIEAQWRGSGWLWRNTDGVVENRIRDRSITDLRSARSG